MTQLTALVWKEWRENRWFVAAGLFVFLGLPLAHLWRFRQAPTTLNLLEGPTVDALEVVRLNDCSHHTAFFGEAVHRAL